MWEETCVALDLETTGLSPVADEIIEVGAVKFRNGRVLETFHSLVNPRRPLTYRIQALTGITGAELQTAPPWAVVAGDLVSFMGSHPVVGHSIGFDLSFLSNRGIQAGGPAYDTYELACVLLPGLSDYSLTSVASALGLPLCRAHRALDDAQLAAAVFGALLERAAGLSPETLAQMAEVSGGSNWPLARVLRQIEPRRVGVGGPYPSAQPGVARPAAIKSEPSTVEPLDLDAIADYLAADGPLAGAILGFERRDGQVEMARMVAATLSGSGQLMVEAGTGVGKSMAYLLPAMLFCLQNGCRLVVSTNTINLQEQLVNKDIPALIRALDQTAQGLRVAVLKGRGNYLCLRRWQTLLQNPGQEASETRSLLRLLVWLSDTERGDRAEVNLRKEDMSVWAKVASPRDGCAGERCAHKQSDRCFFYRARRLAEAAHVLVVNHALLLSDAAAGNMVLPDYRYLVIDEAHHLESEATQQFGFVVRQQDIGDLLRRLGPSEAGRGVLGQVERLVRAGGGPLLRQELRQWQLTAASLVEEARRRAVSFFDVVARFVRDHSDDRGEYARQLRLDRGSRAQPAWSEVEMSWENFGMALEDLEKSLGRLHTILEDLGDALGDAGEELALDLAEVLQGGSELRRRLNAIVASPDAGYVYWAAWDEADAALSLHAAPLSVAEPLNRTLFESKDAVVLASATMTVGGSFSYVKERLGLESAADLVIEAPFDYRRAALVCLVKDIPEPAHPGYQQALGEVLLDLGRALKGRTLALFTSNSALRAAHAAIAGPLGQEGVLVLGQGVDSSARQLVEALKASRNVVALGTSSLWEGIDVVGEALSLLVMARLPFPVPSDPVFAARAELFEDPFNEFTVPQAVLRFKQGFGRLIRSRSDRGVMVVLDRRLETKRYGSVFVESLPGCTVKSGPARLLARQVVAWLEGGGA